VCVVVHNFMRVTDVVILIHFRLGGRAACHTCSRDVSHQEKGKAPLL